MEESRKGVPSLGDSKNLYTERACIFCKIADGDVPAEFIWKDENHFAIMDINPYAKGHVMVIPREHTRWVWDIADEKYSKYLLAVKKTAKILGKAFDTDCVQEVIAGFGVPHTHIHLFPRTREDGLGEIPHGPLEPKLTDDEVEEIYEKIKAVVE